MIDLELGAYFFHYTTREAAFEHILQEGKLRLSPYFRMRDPLEAQPPSMSASMMVGPDLDALSALSGTHVEAQALLGQRRRETKLLSLTVDDLEYEGPDADFGRGYARARMWEVYAEKHRGVCLVFRRERFEELAMAQIDARGGKAISGVVSYTKTGLGGTAAATLLPRVGVTSEQLAEDHLAKHARPLFLLKLDDWKSEHEYRFVELAPGGDYTYVGFEDSLAAVIVGKEFPAWQVYGAIEMCRPSSAQLWQMAWELNRPMPLHARLPDGGIVRPDGSIKPKSDDPLDNEVFARFVGMEPG
jgi:hypothetical protein